MKDNWSLKNKKKTVDTKFYENKPQRGVTTVDVYLAEDIEILKQKIIEDIEKDWIVSNSNSEYISRRDVIKITKKRFGDTK